MDELKEYSQMIDEFAWYGRGDVFQIAKVAKRLKRDYMQDLAERKQACIDGKPFGLSECQSEKVRHNILQTLYTLKAEQENINGEIIVREIYKTKQF